MARSCKGEWPPAKASDSRIPCMTLQVAHYPNNVDQQSDQHLKNQFFAYVKWFVVADPRRTEPKKLGGPGARARYQQSYS
ncbi:hypothetical protein OSTOST_26114 [Ostertagia ostertagi]